MTRHGSSGSSSTGGCGAAAVSSSPGHEQHVGVRRRLAEHAGVALVAHDQARTRHVDPRAQVGGTQLLGARERDRADAEAGQHRQHPLRAVAHERHHDLAPADPARGQRARRPRRCVGDLPEAPLAARAVAGERDERPRRRGRGVHHIAREVHTAPDPRHNGVHDPVGARRSATYAGPRDRCAPRQPQASGKVAARRCSTQDVYTARTSFWANAPSRGAPRRPRDLRRAVRARGRDRRRPRRARPALARRRRQRDQPAAGSGGRYRRRVPERAGQPPPGRLCQPVPPVRSGSPAPSPGPIVPARSGCAPTRASSAAPRRARRR